MASTHDEVHKQISVREHIKKRSMWAGSKKNQPIECYVVKDDKIVLDTVHYPPVLYKMIDEIIVNAIDQHTKYPKLTDEIKITLTKEGELSVYNRGTCIPVRKEKNLAGDSIYLPEMVFTNHYSGSNLNDDEGTDQVTGGQNGIGAKITVDYSTLFIIETADLHNKKLYKQEIINGLDGIQAPKITKLPKSVKKEFTRITFVPNYKAFGLQIDKFYENLFTIVKTRAYQTAAYTNIKMSFNDYELHFKKFIDYCQLFMKGEGMLLSTQMTSKKYSDYPWDVCIGLSDSKTRQLSMINGVYTHRGGNHINHIKNYFVSKLQPRIEKELKKFQVRFNKNLLLNVLFIFMKGNVVDAEFLSQTKEAVSNSVEQFADYEMPASFIKQLWGFVKHAVLDSFLKKQTTALTNKVIRSKIDVPKYREAELCRNAKKRHLCCLIITEGDSATATAHAGLVDKKLPNFDYQYFGTYSVKGVPMNGLKKSVVIDEKTHKKKSNTANDFLSKRTPIKSLIDNERLDSLLKILGISYTKTYDFTSKGEKEWAELRYGYVTGLTDQDVDGFNIFGLLCVFFLTYWPNLIKRGFIRRIFTPLIRAYPKNSKTNNVKEFYTETEANEWAISLGEDTYKKQYKAFKYYKGLGTHNAAFGEVRQIFKNINTKIRSYVLDENAIKNMFAYYGSDTKARKEKLKIAPTHEEIISGDIPLSYQFNHDTRLYQRDNIIRKLLSCIDGFVESRRKVFYAARIYARKEIKVQSLAGEVVSKANYHHADAGLGETIIKMAQAYPAARNLPLLQPLGMFGSRSMGYKDSAASRYISTTLNKRLADTLFRKEDDFILEYVTDDGCRYEPKYYIPIIPYAICENNTLPATGWKGSIYARRITSVIKNTRDMIKGTIKKCRRLPIWNKDFNGEMRVVNNKQYFVGSYTYNKEKDMIHITELPPSKYSYGYCYGSDDAKKKIQKSKDEQNKQTRKSRSKKQTTPDSSDDDSDTESSAIAKSHKKRELSSYVRMKEHVEDVWDNTAESIDITIKLKPGAFSVISEEYGSAHFDCIEEYFDLKEVVDNQLNLVSENNEVIEFTTYEEIFNYWYNFRKNLYKVRVEREVVLNELMIKMLENMQRFSKNHDNYNITSKMTEKQAISIFTKEKYVLFNKSLLENPQYTKVNRLQDLITMAEHGANYSYLLTMNYRSLTEDAYKKREEEIKKLKERLLYLYDMGGKNSFIGAKIWLKELDELEKAINDGLASDWFYGDNEYTFDDGDDDDNKKPTKKTTKRASKKTP